MESWLQTLQWSEPKWLIKSFCKMYTLEISHGYQKCIFWKGISFKIVRRCVAIFWGLYLEFQECRQRRLFSPFQPTNFVDRKNLISDPCPFLDENTSPKKRHQNKNRWQGCSQTLGEEDIAKIQIFFRNRNNPKISLSLKACEAAGWQGLCIDGSTATASGWCLFCKAPGFGFWR